MKVMLQNTVPPQLRLKFGQERDMVLLNALNDEFHDMLSGDIIQRIESKGDLEALKFASRSTLRLRKGTITRTERRTNASTTDEARTEDNPISLNNEETESRTFSCSLTPLFRSDLTPNIQNEFLDNIRSAMISVTNYIYEYGIQMFKLVLLFKNATFAATENGTITLEQKNDVLISDVLPTKLSVTIYNNILSSTAKP
ncbi:hypothetical protein G6F56_005936 [Rhizopus delemar]|nr:hypothetical protein G6F56_005936 [Rhizopus delemar]